MTVRKRMSKTRTTRPGKKVLKRAKPVGPAGGPPAAGQRLVRIQMYNVGFGDAFLVLIPHADSHLRILFDCGSIEAAEGRPMNGIVEQIVEATRDSDGVSRIDVVVATHRHKDHVSGFANAIWKQVQVKEVWMPWTENPKDQDAGRIRDIQSKLAVALDSALTLKAAGMKGADLELLRLYQGVVKNALMLSNAPAMKTLHNGFAGQPMRSFLPEKQDGVGEKQSRSRTFVTDALPGVKVHILGPPRDEKVIRDMDPPKGESYLRVTSAVDRELGATPPPFGGEFRYVRSAYSKKFKKLALSETEEKGIQSAGQLSDLAVAVALDKAVNGTSLMLILEVAGTYLLFPGDAQWGTWEAAMADPEWRSMLESVSFYKVGHHGSHNATPKDFVEALKADDIWAMASTLERKVWPDIPKAALLTALSAKHVHIARSDRSPPHAAGFRVDDAVTEVQIPI
jgi:beta-lactamase superfamily II metal-dependent hydrolase